ncbi:MAG TPA: glycoside hydrolase family 15 protein [Acidiphilium sp.]|nr:MAG: glucoamylase [Acidiphilium sp. 21-60-14]OYV90720.1 MAG: glucoamylase [Acidiphilium sp. 37-60-79]HQT89022.1 glycoside hydrolase family 15 protein [Acidiphilium sp.]HQU24119.1 glycoside hydrolase family 15 protein [Acidiphilium sp.]
MPDTPLNLDFAVIGNGSVAALIDRDATHQWCCWPRLDGDPVFHGLLSTDPAVGRFTIRLDRQTHTTQRYLPNTAILETILHDDAGNALRVLDFCPRFRNFGRMFRPPMLVRRIEPITGHPRVTIAITPGFAYGELHPKPILGSNHLRFAGPDFALRVTTDLSLAHLVHQHNFTIANPATLFISNDEPLDQATDVIFNRFFTETQSYWHNWVTDLNIPFDWQEAVIRSAITLKLCSYDDTGGIVAALTTSLPEAPGSGRNWDYRFCWLRDSFFTIAALNRLSATRTMVNYLGFVLDIVHGHDGTEIPPLFPVAPGMALDELFAPHLPGFAGDGPVRVGNAAASQRQNDGYGAIILSLAQLFVDQRLTVRGDAALYERLCPLGDIAERVALEPDAGIWEFRGSVRVHSFSAVMGWAALSRLALIANALGRPTDADRWSARAAVLRSTIMARIVTPEGWLSGVLDQSVCDASVLILPELGFIDAKHPTFLTTLDVVKRRLMRDGFMLRYDEADDFGKPETAFLLCSFWYVNALALAGRRDDALELFERILAVRNHVGLLSEDLAPATADTPAKLWGNFPQTYSQVGLILCATRLSRSWEDGLWRAS